MGVVVLPAPTRAGNTNKIQGGNYERLPKTTSQVCAWAAQLGQVRKAHAIQHLRKRVEQRRWKSSIARAYARDFFRNLKLSKDVKSCCSWVTMPKLL